MTEDGFRLARRPEGVPQLHCPSIFNASISPSAHNGQKLPCSGYSLILWCPRASAKLVWIYTPSQEATLPGTTTLQPHPCKRDQAGFDSTSEGMWWSLMLLAPFLLPELSNWGCARALRFAMWHFRWEAKEWLCQPPLSGSLLNKNQITDICCVWEKGGSVVFKNNQGCRKINTFPQSQVQFPIVPGNPHGRERHHAVLTRKGFTKNTKMQQLQYFFFWNFLFVSVLRFFWLLKKAVTGRLLVGPTITSVIRGTSALQSFPWALPDWF